MPIKKLVTLLLMLGSLVSFTVAAEDIRLSNIKVKGLKRFKPEIVLENISIKKSDNINLDNTDYLIEEIYAIGLFQDVKLKIDSTNNLIISVVERPLIKEVKINGTKMTKSIKNILLEHQIIKGRVFVNSKLEAAKKALINHFLSNGKFGITVNYKIEDTKNNNKKVILDIYKTDTTKIKKIIIKGNNNFKDSEIISNMRSNSSHMLSWLKGDDKYVQELLNADLEAIRSFYLDRGFLGIEIESTQTKISLDKKYAYVTINLNEGPRYRFGSSKITGNTTDVKLDNFLKVIKANNTFSRSRLFAVKEAIRKALTNQGYYFANVDIEDFIKKDNLIVDVNFVVNPGKRVFVNNIIISGNNITRDDVIRRQIPQMIGENYSSSKVQAGKDALVREGFAKNIEVEVRPLEFDNGKVDVEYKIEESKTTQLSFNAAYSSAEKLSLDLSADMHNFLGTGNDVNVMLQRTATSKRAYLGYYNPFALDQGIGFGYNLSYSTTNNAEVSKVSRYSTSSIGMGVNWGFRVSPYEKLSLGLNWSYNKISLPEKGSEVSFELDDQIREFGEKRNEFSISTGYLYKTLNSYMLPTEGTKTNLSLRATLPGSNMTYYTATGSFDKYIPLRDDSRFILLLRSRLGYMHGYGGSKSQVPINSHFFLGGVDSVRGYDERSLGAVDSKGFTYGGNLSVFGSVALIVPPPFIKDSENVRTSIFIDAGQVYNTVNKPINGTYGSNGLRYSFGVELLWNTPLGAPMKFSYGIPVKSKHGDEIQRFGFSMAIV